MRLTIFIDAKAFVYPGREMNFLLLSTLESYFAFHFSDLELKFQFFAHEDDLVIVDHKEAYFWHQSRPSFRAAPNLLVNAEAVIEHRDLPGIIGEFGEEPYLIVSPEHVYFSEIFPEALVLPVTAFGDPVVVSARRSFADLAMSLTDKKIRVYLDTDDTVLDRKRSLAAGQCSLNQRLFAHLESLPKQRISFQQITSRSLPDKSVGHSKGEHEIRYQIPSLISQSKIKKFRQANAMHMEAVLSAVGMELMIKGSPPDCYGEDAIYTSGSCSKLEAIYRDFLARPDELPAALLLFDDDANELDRSNPDLDQAYRQIEGLGVEVHLVLVSQAGVFSKENFRLYVFEPLQSRLDSRAPRFN